LDLTRSAEISEPPAALVSSPVIQPGRDSRTAIIGFISASTRRLVTIETDLLPEELGKLAEKLRLHIIDIGARQNDRSVLARSVKEALLADEFLFEPEVLRYLAAQAHDQIIASSEDSIESLSRKLRLHIIDIGARLSGRGLRTSAGPAKLEEIPRSFGGEAVATSVPYWIQLRTVSSWPAPTVGAGDFRLVVSDSGQDALVSWAQADRVFYRVSKADGWTDPQEIQLTETVTLEKAYELLESRVRNR
jgi:hypothetical protein